MEQRFVAQKAELLKNQASVQRGNQQLQKDINYNNPNDPFYQDEEEKRIIDRYEKNFKAKHYNAAKNYPNSQFELDQLLNEQDGISPEKKKKARFLNEENYNNYDMKSPNTFTGKSVDRVQLLQYLKNGVIQPTHLNQYFNYESDQVFKFSQSPYSQINIEQKGRLRNYESAINLAASSILQDRYTYNPFKKNDLLVDKFYKPHSGFILRWDFVTELPYNVEKIKVNYGFFQKGDALFTYRSTDEQRNDLVYRSTTHHYQTSSEKSIRKCLISETLPIKNIKLNAESVLYFDLWIWEKNNLNFPSIYGWSILEMLGDDLSLNSGKFKLPLYSKEYNPYLTYQTGIPFKSDIVFLYLTIQSPDDEVRVKSQTSLVEQYLIPKLHLKPQNKEILQKFKIETDKKTFGSVQRKVKRGDDSDDIYAQNDSLRKDFLHNGLYQPQDRPFQPRLQPKNEPFEVQDISAINKVSENSRQSYNNNKDSQNLQDYIKEMEPSYQTEQNSNQQWQQQQVEEDKKKQKKNEQELNNIEKQIVQQITHQEDNNNYYEELFYHQKDQFSDMKLIKSNFSTVQDQEERENLVTEEEYFKSSVLNLHQALENQSKINLFFALKKIDNLEQVIDDLILRIRVFVLFEDQKIYSREDDVSFKISREENLFEIDYIIPIKFDFDYQQVFHEKNFYKKLRIFVNFMDINNNQVGWISKKLFIVKQNTLMIQTGNIKSRMRIFKNLSQEYEQSDTIVDFHIKMQDLNDDTTKQTTSQIPQIQKQILTFMFQKIYNLDPKDQQLLFSIQLKKDDEQNPEIFINDLNCSDVKLGKVVFDQKINNLEFTTLATQQIQVQKKDLRKVYSFYNQNIFLEIIIFTQILKKPPQIIGKFEIPIVCNTESGLQIVKEDIPQKLEIKPIPGQKKQQNQIYGEFQVQFVKQNQHTSEFFSKYIGFNIKLNELIDYQHQNTPFSYDVFLYVNSEKIFDNFGKLCHYQYPKLLMQTKKGAIQIKHNIVIPLNFERIKYEHGSRLNQLLIVIKIYSHLNNSTQPYGWGVHQLAKKDSLNVGDFKLILIAPPLVESQLLNTSPLQKTKTKLSLSIQSCRLDDANYFAKLPSQK